MEKILVFGHKKPDTDSVTSSIALSYLKNKLGFNTIPMVLGDINNETQFVLNYFNVEVPKYLNDVKLQIKDINYRKNFFLNYKQSIYEAYLYMIKNQISTLPITNEEQKLLGIISMKDIAHHQFVTAHINYLLLIKIVIKTRIVNTSWKNDKETSCRRDKKIRSLV